MNTAAPRFDLDGFLLETEAWNEDLARHIARMDGVGELTPRQLQLLHVLRASYRRQEAVPALAHVCHLEGQDGDCMGRLFPAPREAWRIAGLPNPGEEAKAYL